jgi:hypothetical protein
MPCWWFPATALEERIPKEAENSKAILGKVLQTIPPQPYRQ